VTGTWDVNVAEVPLCVAPLSRGRVTGTQNTAVNVNVDLAQQSATAAAEFMVLILSQCWQGMLSLAQLHV
jgi:hypothetical protein